VRSIGRRSGRPPRPPRNSRVPRLGGHSSTARTGRGTVRSSPAPWCRPVDGRLALPCTSSRREAGRPDGGACSPRTSGRRPVPARVRMRLHTPVARVTRWSRWSMAAWSIITRGHMDQHRAPPRVYAPAIRSRLFLSECRIQMRGAHSLSGRTGSNGCPVVGSSMPGTTVVTTGERRRRPTSGCS